MRDLKFLPRTTGLFQASGLVLYITLFAALAYTFEQWLAAHAIRPQPIMGIILFLLAFVISATISASIVFGYPVLLFFGNRRKEAFQVVLWSMAWLIFFFSAFFLIVFLSSAYMPVLP